MEPVDFGGALLRRWWLLLVLGLVGLSVGLALPVSHHSGHSSPLSWSTTAIVGASPPGGAGGSGALAGAVTTSQISFYAHTDQVMLAAAKQAGRTGSLTELEREITVTADTTKKGAAAAAASTIKISGTGSTPDRSAAFTNAFANQLGDYMSNLVAQRNQGQVAAAKKKVIDLQSEIAALGKTKVSYQSRESTEPGRGAGTSPFGRFIVDGLPHSAAGSGKFRNQDWRRRIAWPRVQPTGSRVCGSFDRADIGSWNRPRARDA